MLVWILTFCNSTFKYTHNIIIIVMNIIIDLIIIIIVMIIIIDSINILLCEYSKVEHMWIYML